MAREPLITSGALVLVLIAGGAVALGYTPLFDPGGAPQPVAAVRDAAKAPVRDAVTRAKPDVRTAKLAPVAKPAEAAFDVMMTAPPEAADPPPEDPVTETTAADKPRTEDTAGPAFDILRVEPDGVSVFAGRAKPDTQVTIRVDGTPFATARADSTGSWTIVASHPFKAGKNEISLTSTYKGQTTSGQSVAMVLKEGAKPKPEPAPTRVVDAREAAPATISGTTRRLEKLVAAAKADNERLGFGDVASAANGSGATDASASLPVPITFETNSARLTAEGRRNAALMAQYLQLRRLKSVMLTGHADERGPDGYNMSLSRQRLDAISAFLRSEGFTGELKLVAKGESEPYAKVDRSAMPKSKVWEYDRRVELRVDG